MNTILGENISPSGRNQAPCTYEMGFKNAMVSIYEVFSRFRSSSTSGERHICKVDTLLDHFGLFAFLWKCWTIAWKM
jgi:hypothetical protein